MKIEFYKHNLSHEDKEECRKVLDSIFLTTGDVAREFETRFAQYQGTNYTVGLTSCTLALFLGLKYFDIKEGDEVITSPMSFIASANCIEHCGARPVFVDVEQATGNIDCDLIEKAITPRTKAILPVHLYGQMCEMDKIKSIAERHNLKVIEDACHCVEGSRNGIRPGQLGDAACYSFYATKNLTSGEGGAITCNDAQMYDWIVKARLHGMSKSAADRYTGKYQHYDMEFLGYKCNMSNIQAALLVRQLDRLDEYWTRKEEIARIYDEGFRCNPNVELFRVRPNTKHGRHLYTIRVKPEKRDEYMHKLQESGVACAVNFRAIHLMSFYREKYSYKY
jgi:UDP-4-amino-4-deoxy-L-arabinose-oxoglutarate aminotransferase